MRTGADRGVWLCGGGGEGIPTIGNSWLQFFQFNFGNVDINVGEMNLLKEWWGFPIGFGIPLTLSKYGRTGVTIGPSR